MTTVIQCPTDCTVTIVHELALPPLQLSTQDGALIAAAIVMVWTVGWAIRQAIRAMNVDQSKSTSADD